MLSVQAGGGVDGAAGGGGDGGVGDGPVLAGCTLLKLRDPGGREVLFFQIKGL